MLDDNPFASFAFDASAQPAAPKRPRVTSSPKVSAPSGNAAAKASAPSGSSAAAKASQAKPAPSASSAPLSAAEKLREYRLIASFRQGKRASVDDFHHFLLSLGTGEEPGVGDPQHGMFWALVASLLSVQCRDRVALAATRAMLRLCAGEGAAGVAALGEEELLRLVHSCNFCASKARYVRAAAEHAQRHGGRVPREYDALVQLPGVGPKIANLMRSVAFGEAEAGIVVDTHVFRVATRLGWVDGAAARAGPEGVRVQLERWVPREERVGFTLAVVGFGQLTRGGGGWGGALMEHASGGARATRLPDSDAAEAESCVASGANIELAKSIVARMDASGER